jgi:hypothetical protein
VFLNPNEMSLSKEQAQKLKVSDYFSRANVLFWDADVSALNFVNDFGYIIGRVLNRFSIEEGQLDVLDKIYRKELIQHFCKESKELYDKEDIHYLSKRYNVPINEFLAYRKKAALEKNKKS